MDTTSDFLDLNTPAQLLILSTSSVLASFVVLGKLTLLQPQNEAIPEEELYRYDIDLSF